MAKKKILQGVRRFCRECRYWEELPVKVKTTLNGAKRSLGDCTSSYSPYDTSSGTQTCEAFGEKYEEKDIET